jgi:alpha-tubulin suppressor-like RCC1 family protein/Tol biopolymer transport system component
LAVVGVVAGSNPSSASIGGNERVSVTSSGGQLSPDTTALYDMTPNGQYVLFGSTANELGMASGSGVFLRDRLAGTTTRVDAVAGGTAQAATMSDDGRYVVTIVSGTIRLHDRVAATTTTLGTASAARRMAISGDGSQVAFTLSNGSSSVRDVAAGTTSAIGAGDVLALSGDGRYLVWRVGAGIVRRDLTTSTTVSVSLNTSNTLVAATQADISANGDRVVFQSIVNSIVAGDGDGKDDIFLWDAGTGTRTLISTAATSHTDPAISADGSSASFYGSGTSTGETFVTSLPSGTPERAALRMAGGTPAPMAATSSPSRLSSDGRFVAFASGDAGLVPNDTNAKIDLFVRDRSGDPTGSGAGTVTGAISSTAGGPLDHALVTLTGPNGTFTTLTASDGSFALASVTSGRYRLSAVAEGHTGRWYPAASSEPAAVPIVVADGEAVQASFALDPTDIGPAETVTRSAYQSDGASSFGSASADGRYLAFSSVATNLVPGDTNGVSDIFVKDRQTGTIVRASVDAGGDQLAVGSFGPSITADGRSVAFVTAADGVVASDADGLADVFVRNLDTATTTRHTDGLDRPPASGGDLTELSGDGGSLAYARSSTTTSWVEVRTDGSVAATTVGAMTYLSHDGSVAVGYGAAGTFGFNVAVSGGTFTCTNPCSPASLSRNGRWVAYSTDGQTIQVRDLQTGTVSTYGTLGARWWSIFGGAPQSLVTMTDIQISDDGRYVAMSSTRKGLDGLTDSNDVGEIWVLDRQTETYRRASLRNDRSELTAAPALIDLSADGRTVFVRGAVARDDTNGVDDIVAIDLDDDFSGASGTGAIAGTVSSEGAPVADARVLILDGTRWVSQLTTAADGSYRIAGLKPAGYRVQVADPSDAHLGRFAPSAVTAAEAEVDAVATGVTDDVDVELPPTPGPTAVPGPAVRLNKASIDGVAPAVSANGRFVAYVSATDGLIVRERVLGTDRRLDPGADVGTVSQIDISDDGSRVAFVSKAPNLVPEDTDNARDVFVADTATGALQLVSILPPHSSSQEIPTNGTIMDLSADGRVVTYKDGYHYIYRRDLDEAAAELVTIDGAISGAAMLNADGSRLAYGTSGGGAVVVGEDLAVPYRLAAEGSVTINDLDETGDHVLWSGNKPGVPGAGSDGSGLYLTDLTTGTVQQVHASSGGVHVGGASAAQLTSDGRSVLMRSTSALAPGADGDRFTFVRDLETGAVEHVDSPGGLLSWSADGNTVVSVSNGQLWVAPVRGARVPSAPTITLAGTQGAGAVVVWDPPHENPSDRPTVAVVDRFEGGADEPTETVVVPYDPDFGLATFPSVTPGSTQRFEVRLRNAVGDSLPDASDELSAEDQATVAIQVDGPDGPVPWAAVVAFDLAGHPVNFAPSDEEGRATIHLVPGSYRVRAYASQELTPYLDGWYGGGPTAGAGVLDVPAGGDVAIDIHLDLPGTVTPVSQVQATGLLAGGAVNQFDASGDGRWVSFITAKAFLNDTAQPKQAVYLRDTQSGSLIMPCAAAGALDGGGSKTAVSDDGRYIAIVPESGKEVLRCDRTTNTIERVTSTIGGAPLTGTTSQLQMSADGSVITFTSTATNLAPADGSIADVYAWRPAAATVTRLTADGSNTSSTSITADGTTVGVVTGASLSPQDVLGDVSFYLVDTTTGAARLASPHPIDGSAHATTGMVSADGSAAVFTSSRRTTSLASGPTVAYRWRAADGSVELASTDGRGKPHVGNVSSVSISADGSRVAYTVTLPETLDVRGDEGTTSSFVAEIATGYVRQIDVADEPRATTTGSNLVELAADGASATFRSSDALLPALEEDATSPDLFRWTGAPRPAYVPVAGDGVSPVLSIPTGNLVEVAATGQTTAPITWSASAIDDVDGPIPVTCAPGTGAFPVGDTTVRCSATDAAGNVKNGTFTVHVAAVGAVDHSTGASHGCAVLETGTVNCWGSDQYGQLGRSTTGGAGPYPPSPVAGLTNVVQVEAGDTNNCARRTDGTVWCWGNGTEGQNGLALFSNTNYAIPVWLLPPGATGLSLRGRTACTTHEDGGVRCWGRGSNGQLGNGASSNSNVPVDVVGISNAVQVSSGDIASCAVLADGTVRCWGSNASGLLGTGSTTPASSNVPLPVVGITDASAVHVTPNGACAIVTGGAVRCWGSNTYGQLGNGTLTSASTPVPVSGLTGAVEIVGARHSMCIRRADGSMSCWGRNDLGQLGDGTQINSSVPVAVTGVTDAARLTYGLNGTCLVDAGGRIRCLQAPAPSSLLFG